MWLFYLTITISLFYYIEGYSNNLKSSPVFVTDNDHVLKIGPQATSNPFLTLTESLFQFILQNSIKNSSTIIVFAEENLCTEDLSLRDNLGTPFYHLRQSMAEQNSIYLPSVINPFKILSEMFPPQSFNIFHLRSANTKLQVFEGHYKYFYIFFEDGSNETRSDTLRRHDLIMREVYFVLRQLVSGPVVAFYTGKKNPVIRHSVRRNTHDFKSNLPTTSSVFYFSSPTTLYKFGGFYIMSEGEPTIHVTAPPQAIESYIMRNEIINRLVYKSFVLEFHFTVSNTDWLLDSISFMDRYFKVITKMTNLRSESDRWFLTGLKENRETVGTVQTSIGASWGTSYECPVALSIKSTKGGKTVVISDYQVVFLLLTILFYGVVSLMDVKANSRYDDPAGKPLTMTTEG